MEVNCDLMKRVIEILEGYDDAGPYDIGGAPSDTQEVTSELKDLLAADPVSSLMSVLYEKRTESFVIKYRNKRGDPVINGNGFNDIVVGGPYGLVEGVSGPEGQAEKFINWVNGHIVRPYLIEAHEYRSKNKAADRCRAVANYYGQRRSALPEPCEERSWCIASEQAADKCIKAVLGKPDEDIFGSLPASSFIITVDDTNENITVTGNGFKVALNGANERDKIANLFRWINRQIEKAHE